MMHNCCKSSAVHTKNDYRLIIKKSGVCHSLLMQIGNVHAREVRWDTITYGYRVP